MNGASAPPSPSISKPDASNSPSGSSPVNDGNFASWLASREFDASAIVWNGDDNNPQDLSGVLLVGDDLVENDAIQDEFLQPFTPIIEPSTITNNDNDGYVSIEDCTSKRSERTVWPLPTMTPPSVVYDAWNKVISSNWQCWQEEEQQHQSLHTTENGRKERHRYSRGPIGKPVSEFLKFEPTKSAANPPSILKKKLSGGCDEQDAVVESSSSSPRDDDNVDLGEGESERPLVGPRVFAASEVDAKKSATEEETMMKPSSASCITRDNDLPEDAQSQVSSYISSSYAPISGGHTTYSSVASPLRGEGFLDDASQAFSAMTPQKPDTTVTTTNSCTYSASPGPAFSYSKSLSNAAGAVFESGNAGGGGAIRITPSVAPVCLDLEPNRAAPTLALSAAPVVEVVAAPTAATTAAYDDSGAMPFATCQLLPPEGDDEDESDDDDIPLMHGESGSTGPISRKGSWSKGRRRRRMRLKK